MNISGQDLIRACSAIGAGLAVSLVSDLVLDRVSQPDTVQQQLDVTLEQEDRSCLPCFLDRPLPRQPVCTVSL